MKNHLTSPFITLCLLIFCLFTLACSDENRNSDSQQNTGTTPDTSKTCKIDTDCELGAVCSASHYCVIAECMFCQPSQICYKTPQNPEGSCSAPECTVPKDCKTYQTCTDGQCQPDPDQEEPDCTDEDDCPDSESKTCHDDKQCDPATVCTTSSDCPAREFCNDDKVCTKATSCQHIECSETERCLPVNLTCVHDCISDATLCTDGLVCNPENAKCQTPACINPSATPGSCNPNGSTPHYDPETCSCVACFDDDHCHEEKSCTSTNICIRTDCETTCDISQPGTCSGQTPYCTNNCCSECLADADCPTQNTCTRGVCIPPPPCDPSDSLSCPVNKTCNPETNTCVASDDTGCGFCNPDCTCPNGLICDGFMCTGCTEPAPGQPGQCPEDTMCDLITNSCIPSIL